MSGALFKGNLKITIYNLALSCLLTSSRVNWNAKERMTKSYFHLQTQNIWLMLEVWKVESWIKKKGSCSNKRRVGGREGTQGHQSTSCWTDMSRFRRNMISRNKQELKVWITPSSIAPTLGHSREDEPPKARVNSKSLQGYQFQRKPLQGRSTK